MFNNDSIEKQLNISVDGITYTNAELGSEEMELTEQLCSESRLRFGTCEASIFSIRILDTVEPLKGKRIAVSMELRGEETEQFEIGQYKVDSDKPTADRRYRDIVAYDVMYDIISADVAEWYNTILPEEDSTVTLKEFRTSFLAYFGIEQEELTLINDSMIVEKTIEPSGLSGKTVITAICEINGCFGHIGRNGKFQYIFLKEMKEGLYPSDTLYPADDLYPTNPVNAEQLSKNTYISATYEDYTTAKINKLLIRQEEFDIGCIYGDGDNCYIVQDNFLVYGKSSEDLAVIAKNLYSVISKVWYRPAHVEAKGNPCLEVWDGIVLGTKYETVYTYILQRTLKGIQALRDTYDAEGEQYQTEDVNSVHQQIIQLKGKSNVLERTIEETRLTITDIENGLQSQITMNANSISTEVIRAKSAEESLSSRITQTAESLRLEVTERTSMYNEEINTLQGGMDGSIDLTFFNHADNAVVTMLSEKQCVTSGTASNGTSLAQDISLPAGTYLFSYEWLRNLGPFINAYVKILDLSITTEGVEQEIYSENLGYAWPETDVWTKESFQFTLTKMTRIRFEAEFWPPVDYPDRANDLYLTNIALYGTAQSVADAISDMKAELIIQSDRISSKVSRDNVISEINQTAESITIKAEKIDLVGLVETDAFKTKYATIDTLDATSISLQNLIAQKASVESLNAVNASIQSLNASKLNATDLTAERIEALDISVRSAKVTGGFDASKITSGTISAARIDVAGLIRSNTFRGSAITVKALYATEGITVDETACVWKTARILNSSGNAITIKYLGA